MVVYNVGDMKRRGSPANIHGSSDSVTETGAQQGKSSSTATIRQTEGNGQEKSSGRAGVEVSGINNRTATELDGADIVFADGSISALSEERKITPETSKEARCEILKDRTIRPASVEYDKLGDTDTAAIYDGLSAAQMAQAKKAIPSHCEEAWAESGRSEKQPDRISVPILQRECRRKCAASKRVWRTIYDGCDDKKKESDVVKKLQAGESAAATSLLSDSNISIQDIFRSVKAGEGRFLKYAPDAFLNDAQNAAKRRAIQRQTGEGASYKIDGNGRASVEVKKPEHRNERRGRQTGFLACGRAASGPPCRG